MEIRQLTVSDMADALRLSTVAGWNQTAADVARLIALDPEGCFAAHVDGQIVAVTTATTYGTALGWIGMVLVDPAFRRQGIATALMQAAMAYLRQRGVITMKLDATPAGRPVYERLGFEPEHILERWLGESPPRDGEVTTGEWGQVAALDRTVFGADRGPLIERILSDSPFPLYVARAANGDVAGYALVRPGRLASYIGPVVAGDAAMAGLLVSAASGRCGGPVFIDIDPSFPGAVDTVGRLGFVRQRELLRMRLGPALHSRVFAISGPEVG